MGRVADERKMEDSVLADLEGATMSEDTPAAPVDHFKIKPGKPLPDGFENAPRGEEAHLCVDHANQYQPTWHQLLIEKRFDHDRDPQIFPGSSPVSVALDFWTDVPPRVIEALKSAVEVSHSRQATLAQIQAGEPATRSSVPRRRFIWQSVPSAKA